MGSSPRSIPSDAGLNDHIRRIAMTSTEQIYKRLTEIFHDVFDDQSIVPTPEMKASDVPEWDSLNHINLIVAIEARFKIKFKSTELESLRNVGHLVELIERKLNAPPRG